MLANVRLWSTVHRFSCRMQKNYLHHILLRKARQMSKKSGKNWIDGGYTINDTAKNISTLLSRVHLVLKGILKVRQISAWWISRTSILTNDQQNGVKTAKKLLKTVSIIYNIWQYIFKYMYCYVWWNIRS